MRLARANTALLVIIIAINAYIICAPLMPLAIFWAGSHITHQTNRIHERLVSAASDSDKMNSIPSDNRLLVPAMQLDTAIHEGRDARALRDGPWHRPNASSPDKGGNTVIAAHRFTYTQPRASFYHLDTVHPGDEIGIFWHGKRYLYTVQSVRTVPAADTSIEAQTTDTRLTLYTCTPLWNPKDRLVVVATPKENP